MFGYKQLARDVEEVILTESILDAIAVYQETGQPVISLPHKATMLPQQVWIDNDE